MVDVYLRTVTGPTPVSVNAFKDYIRLPLAMTSQDGVITSMLSTATLWGENYTRRDFRDNSYTLTLDTFPTRICLRRDPVESITSITYTLAGVVTTVSSDDYYLKKNVQTSEILLTDGSAWPTDGDEVTAALEGSIVVTFDTESYSCVDDITAAIMAHTAHMWAERGDCTINDAAKDSGATAIYGQFRVVRI